MSSLDPALIQLLKTNPGEVRALNQIKDWVRLCTDEAELLKLLAVDYENLTGPVLMRLIELSGPKTDYFLALALWHFNMGDDDEALAQLKRAKQIWPRNKAICRTEVYFLSTISPDEALDVANEGLVYFPDDKWLSEVRNELVTRGYVSDIRLPPLALFKSETGTGDVRTKGK